MNIESAGGPSPTLTREIFLPSEVVEHLQLSDTSLRIMNGLLRKYERHMLELKKKAVEEEEGVRISPPSSSSIP